MDANEAFTSIRIVSLNYKLKLKILKLDIFGDFNSFRTSGKNRKIKGGMGSSMINGPGWFSIQSYGDLNLTLL